MFNGLLSFFFCVVCAHCVGACPTLYLTQKSGPSNANHTLDSVVDNDVQADNETVKPTNITRTAYDRSLVELAEIRGAAAKAKLQALTDQLMVAARRLKRHYQSVSVPLIIC